MSLNSMIHNAGIAARNNNTSGQRAGPEFQGNGEWWDDLSLADSNVKNRDGDLYHAAMMQRYIMGDQRYRGDAQAWAGTLNTDTVKSAIEGLRARAGQRSGLKNQLSSLSGEQMKEESLLKREADRAVGQGVQKTRENYNRRGLLYSGMREGGEQGVRAQGAAQLQGTISDSRRDYAKKADATKEAIAKLGMAQQQQALELQRQVFETSMRNSVARQQAFQQLGSGVGYLVGAGLAGRGSGGNYDNMNPNANNYERLPSRPAYLGDASNNDMTDAMRTG